MGPLINFDRMNLMTCLHLPGWRGRTAHRRCWLRRVATIRLRSNVHCLMYEVKHCPVFIETAMSGYHGNQQSDCLAYHKFVRSIKVLFQNILCKAFKIDYIIHYAFNLVLNYIYRYFTDNLKKKNIIITICLKVFWIQCCKKFFKTAKLANLCKTNIG